jgi:hypothetical protein
MTHRTLIIILFVLLSCAACFAQMSFNGLTPGRSTKADVERTLGQPVRELSETLSEYKSDKETGQIFVQYRKGSFVVERIEAVYPETNARAIVLRSLNLSSPSALRTNSKGRLEEYFSQASVVITHAGADAASGVSRVGYYSPELFESAVAKATPARQNPPTQSGASSSISTLPERPLPQTSGPSISVDRSGRVRTSGIEGNSASGPATSKRTTTTTRTYPSTGGRSPMTVTTRSSPAGANENSSKEPSVAVGMDESEAAEKEIHLSANELLKFVGRYEFTQSTIPSLKAATVEMVGGRLKLTIGSATYTLVPIAGDDLEVVGQTGSDQIRLSDKVHFKILDKPSTKVQFLMRAGKVDNLFYTEEHGDEINFAVAVPKH